jgi:hypothetical protein
LTHRPALLACAAALAALGCGDDDAAQPDAGPDAGPDAPVRCLAETDGGEYLSRNGRTSYEEEPHLVADGDGGVVVAWVGVFPNGGTTNGYAVSHDYGTTWTRPSQVDAPDARVSSDPTLAIDSTGAVFLGWVGYRPSPLGQGGVDMHVYVARLDAATGTFGAPVDVSQGGDTGVVDKPWLIIDTTDQLLVTWEDSTNGSALMSAHSTDRGATWSSALVARDSVFRNLAMACVDRERPVGTQQPIYVVFNEGQHAVSLRRSDDGGASWVAPRAGTLAGDAIFQDPSCVVQGSRVWVSYSQGTDDFVRETSPTATGLRVLRSDDAAVNFGPPVTVSDGAPGTRYFLSKLAISASGRLELVYYQGTLGDVDNLMRAESLDGGATWSHESMAEPGTLATGRGLPCFPGDYLGLASAGDSLYVAYGDNNSGKVHIDLRRMAAP